MIYTWDVGDFLTGNVFGFLLLFTRLGAACMLFPGVGESFVAARSRLMFALLFTLLLFPVLGPSLPKMPDEISRMVVLLALEATIGVFLGMIVRLMVMALEFAGQAVALQLGIGNAFAFNPAMATQGSLPGALMGLLGIVLIFASNLHHVFFAGLIKSYALLPAGGLIEIKDMSETIVNTVRQSFAVSIMMAAPFFVLGILLQVGLGLMARLQPTLQVFFVALPLQIMLGFAVFAILMGSMMAFWLDQTADSYISIGLG
ncbi:MAG: flagellar biosynthetic protein FliR [Bdellovibrionales bacterium]